MFLLVDEITHMMSFIVFGAADYKNEKEVGVALAEGMKMGLAKREELFITTKVCYFLSNVFWGCAGSAL